VVGKIRNSYALKICCRFVATTLVFAIPAFSLSAFDLSPVEKLLERLLPGRSEEFRFEPIPADNGKNVFELESKNGKIVIRGDNANSMARGLGVYLRKYANASVSWNADNPIQIPAKLPPVPRKTRAACSVKYRFFLNYCTFGYTMPFWNWREWERCIDWMALNGINMPLAMTGTEKILMEVWKERGFEKAQILKFFTDPPHLPWYHMNNFARWGGPCPEAYVEHGCELQKKILARERELGMTPIIPAFNGRVPVELKKQYPDKKITVLGKGWGWFKEPCYTYFLDPYDPLFAKLQKSFIRHAEQLYGTSHFYGLDPFNEITPPSWEPEYLAKTAKRIYETLAAADKDAVWVQMGWLFYYNKKWTKERIKALLTAVPRGKLVMLDYYCEKQEVWKITDAFFNVPFIWCYLGNFGGKECMAGPLPAMKEKVDAVIKARAGKNLWGVGSTLEGFGVNMVTYEFLFDLLWSDMPDDLKQWEDDYAKTRAGASDPAVSKAWRILFNKVYNRENNPYSGGTVAHSRPRFEGAKGYFVVLDRSFTPKPLWDAWTAMMKANPKTRERDSFQYDLVNIIRQYLGDVSANVRVKMREAYLTGDKAAFDKYAGIFLWLIKDQEEIVRSRHEFLMGKWIAEARRIGKNDAERNAMERGIRSLFSTWDGKNSFLTDYANRDWDGLTRDYYLKRWKMFVDDVGKAMTDGNVFDQRTFDTKCADLEWAFVTDNKNEYVTKPVGDSWKIAQRLFDKYAGLNLHSIKSTVAKNTVASWNSETVTKQFAKHTWDVSKYVKKKGLYIVTFAYRKGRHALSMRNVRIKRDGAIVVSDDHPGQTGNVNRGNMYKLQVDECPQGAKFSLEAEIMATGKDEANSFGDILMEVFDGKGGKEK